jgi:hypothetical protein
VKLGEQVEEHKKATLKYEITMRSKAASVGNIVGPNVPVSMTEVRSCQICGLY